ncbi:MAG: dihydroorotate dehydrogenase electron transfer subunit [Erysipelotrichaceae bacterium]
MNKERVQSFDILSNQIIAKDVYKMCLKGDTSWIKRPGQFINIDFENAYLKRPISISDYDDNQLVIIYKVVGFGTRAMSLKKPGDTLTALVDLGNGFEIMDEQQVLLVGGGVGVPPLYGLAKRLLEKGKEVSVVLGFTSKDDVFYQEEFEALGCKVYLSTNDGSAGEKGFVTDVILKQGLQNLAYYACGPEVMLKALAHTSTSHGLLSFEARMGCGFGACMGCSCKTLTGYKRICVEGPVMDSREILWKD